MPPRHHQLLTVHCPALPKTPGNTDGEKQVLRSWQETGQEWPWRHAELTTPNFLKYSLSSVSPQLWGMPPTKILLDLLLSLLGPFCCQEGGGEREVSDLREHGPQAGYHTALFHGFVLLSEMAQAGLKLMAALLPWALQCWDSRCKALAQPLVRYLLDVVLLRQSKTLKS